jgi:cytochrome d ubiquinol oxidase subunit II
MPFQFDDYMRSSWQGGFLDLLHPFALLSGLLALAMFLMHGAVYLMIRSDLNVYRRAKKVAIAASIAVIALFAIEGLWIAFAIDGMRVTAGLDPNGVANPTLKTVEMASGAWLDNYTKYPLMAIIPVFGFLGAIGVFFLAKASRDSLAFWNSSLSLTGIILTAGFSLFPFIMPSSLNPNHSFTVWDSTGSELTIMVSLIAAVIFVPIILMYTSWCYHKMWGPQTVKSIQKNDHSLY